MTGDRAEFAEPFELAIAEARKGDLASAAGNVARSFVLFYSAGENQAFLAGAVIGASMSGRRRMLPGLVLTMVCGLAARQAYLTAQDIKAIARAAGNGPDPAAA